MKGPASVLCREDPRERFEIK